MKVRSVIVDSLNIDLLDGQVNKLSELIEKILAAKRNPIVLLNEHGDELLRKIPKLALCDMVFSQRDSRSYAGLMTGVAGAGTCAFYIPLEASYGDEKTWLNLEKELITLPYMNNTHMIIPKEKFPILITPTGMLYLKNQDENYSFSDDLKLNKIEI